MKLYGRQFSVCKTCLKDLYLITGADDSTWAEYQRVAVQNKNLTNRPTNQVLLHKLGGEIVNLKIHSSALVGALLGLEVEKNFGIKLPLRVGRDDRIYVEVNGRWFSISQSMKQRFTTPQDVVDYVIAALTVSVKTLRTESLTEEQARYYYFDEGLAQKFLPGRSQQTLSAGGTSRRTLALEQLDEELGGK